MDKSRQSKAISFSSTTTHSVVEPSPTGNNSPNHFRRAAHPFLCRLKDSPAFSVATPKALVDAGFASMAMGLLTFFRLTPLLLFVLTNHLHRQDLLKKVNTKFLIYSIFVWGASIMFVLIILGFLLTLSALIRKRAILLLHPWGLILLYFDAFVWLILALYLHLMIDSVEPLNKTSFSQIQYPVAYFIIIYIDCSLFFVLHYIYATFFITAELTVIENSY